MRGITTLMACGFLPKAKPSVVKCKHCSLTIEHRGWGWFHIEGEQIGKHRCALDPYGYDAAPASESCSFACLGYQGDH